MSLLKSEPKRVIIKVESSELQETTTRKTFKDIKNAHSNKENIGLKFKQLNTAETKCKKMVNRAIQTGEITTADLTSDEPSVDYWKTLAETRAVQLERSFHENEKLKEEVVHLQEENKLCKDMLEESNALVEVLQEMLTDAGGNES